MGKDVLRVRLGSTPVVALVGLLAIFVLPWFVPQAAPVASASYTLGFNNGVASVALAALLAVLTARRVRGSRGAGDDAVENVLAGMLAVPAEPPSNGLRIAFGLTACATTGILLGWYRLLPYAYFSEMGLDLSRLDLMALGLRPHRDFQYTYGPAMFYPAYWLYALSRGRLSIDGAYFATVLTHWVAGLALVHYTVRTLCRGRGRLAVFLCVALAVFNLSLGIGYTPLRFMLPLASLLFLHRTLAGWVANDSATLWKNAALAASLCLFALSISPEIGLATATGITVFFAMLSATDLRRLALVAAVPAASLGIAVLGFSVDYIQGIFSHGRGANNLPVFPTLPILLLIAAACTILPRLGAIGLRQRTSEGALALGMAGALGLLLPAAFGRCDTGHVLFNGLGILILLLAVAARWPSRSAAVAVFSAFVVVHPVFGNLSAGRLVGPALDYRAYLGSTGFDERLNEQVWSSAAGVPTRIRYGKLLPFRNDLLSLLREEKIGTPLFVAHEDVARFLKLTGRFVPEHYSGIKMEVHTPGEVRRKIADLATMDVILVPDDETRRLVATDESSRQWLSRLLFFPEALIPRPHRSSYAPAQEVLKFIRENFRIVGRFRGYEIWRRPGGASWE